MNAVFFMNVSEIKLRWLAQIWKKQCPSPTCLACGRVSSGPLISGAWCECFVRGTRRKWNNECVKRHPDRCIAGSGRRRRSRRTCSPRPGWRRGSAPLASESGKKWLITQKVMTNNNTTNHVVFPLSTKLSFRICWIWFAVSRSGSVNVYVFIRYSWSSCFNIHMFQTKVLELIWLKSCKSKAWWKIQAKPGDHQ